MAIIPLSAAKIAVPLFAAISIPECGAFGFLLKYLLFPKTEEILPCVGVVKFKSEDSVLLKLPSNFLLLLFLYENGLNSFLKV